jgi:hypothetical protein
MKQHKKADKSRLQYRRWTAAEITYLKRNYRRMGDKEIAKRLTEKISTDGKVYQLKQIEKKRNYLGLHRTSEQLKAIKARNTAAGCWSINHWKRWVNQKPIGTVIRWYLQTGKEVLYIKTETGYRKLAHVNWEKANGPIPKGKVIRLKDGNPYNCNPENLECLTKAENGMRNSASLTLSPGWIASCLAYKDKEMQQELLNNHPALIKTAKLNYQLNRKIKQYEK